MKSRPKSPSGFELYYKRLSTLAYHWSAANGITLDLHAFGGVTHVVIEVPAPDVPKATSLKLCTLQPLWELGEAFTISSNRPHGGLDLKLTGHSGNVDFVELHGSHSGVAIGVRLTSDASRRAPGIRVEFDATNVSTPIPERSPINRTVCGIRVLWSANTINCTRVLLLRAPGSITCFTKGNYALAFPSRPAKNGLRTTILYAHADRVDLLYGFIRDPSKTLLRAATSLVFAGLGFLAAWILAGAIVRGTAELAQYLAMLMSLTVPAITAFAELVVLDRHALYSRRRDIGFSITIFAIACGILGTIGAVYLAINSDFGSKQPSNSPLDFRLFFFLAGVSFVILGSGLLGGYRSGFIVPYVCDNWACDRRLYRRYRRRDCYATGRVVCVHCEYRVCMPCPRNYWQRGIEVLDGGVGSPRHDWQYRCQKISEAEHNVI